MTADDPNILGAKARLRGYPAAPVLTIQGVYLQVDGAGAEIAMASCSWDAGKQKPRLVEFQLDELIREAT